jgi:hypothetical protein
MKVLLKLILNIVTKSSLSFSSDLLFSTRLSIDITRQHFIFPFVFGSYITRHLEFSAGTVTCALAGNTQLLCDYVSYDNGDTIMLTGSKSATPIFKPKVVAGDVVGTTT